MLYTSASSGGGHLRTLTAYLGRLLSEVDTIAAEVAMQKDTIQNLDAGMTSHRDEIENINSHVARLLEEERFAPAMDGPKPKVFWCVLDCIF